MSHTPLLSIGMIVKNEIRCLEKCLRALQPLRDAIPCELVIADTGSTDGTREIAQQYADILFDFLWIDDFSAARNAVLGRCRGKWYLSVDADEYLVPDIEELVTFLTGPQADTTDACTDIIRNYTEPNLTGAYSDFPAMRLARIHPALHYEGTIHEVLVHAPNAKIINLRKTVFDHDGYAPVTPEHLEQKAERNMALLEKVLETNPNDLKTLLQCIESSAFKRDALEFYVRRGMDAIMDETCKGVYWRIVAPAIARACIDYAEESSLPEMEEWYQWTTAHFPDSYFVRIDANFCYLRHLQKNPCYPKIIDICTTYLDTVEKYWKFGAPNRQDRISPLRGAHANHATLVRFTLANAYYEEGKKRQLIEELEKFSLLDLDSYYFSWWFSLVAKVADFPAAQKALVRNILPFYEKRETGSEEEKQVWANILTRIQHAFSIGENCAPELCQLYTAFPDTIGVCARLVGAQTVEEGQALLNQIEDWDEALTLPLAVQQAMKLGLVFPDAFYRLSPEKLHGFEDNLVQHGKNIVDYLLYYSTPEQITDWHRLCFAYDTLCALCMYTDGQTNEFRGALSSRFAQIGELFLTEYYNAKVIANESAIDRLPALHRFTWHYVQATKLRQTDDLAGYIAGLRKALTEAEVMKSFVKHLLDDIQAYQRQERIRTAPPELLALAEQVKTILAAYPADDPAVVALKQTPAYQQVAFLIEEPDGAAQ